MSKITLNMFYLLSEELLRKILGYGHIHKGPCSLWISCGNPVTRTPLSPSSIVNTFDFIRLRTLSKVNRELNVLCSPILKRIKEWDRANWNHVLSINY